MRSGDDVRTDHELVRWGFLRGVALVYLIAFISLWVQIDGLIGSAGVLPVEPWLGALTEHYGTRPLAAVPTLLWANASDRALHAVCAAGTLASLLMLVNLWPRINALLAWVFYVSLTTVGRTFLSFQWDILLLETGVIAVLMAPGGLRPTLATATGTPSSVLWLTRWLVFRLMFMSGAVKLMSADAAWWDLTALTYHYETQPLPVWTSWYAHHLPLWFQRASCAVMFAIELGLPFLVFAPRRLRLVAFVGFVGFQIAIVATGNYGFFNLLTLVLCVTLLDDEQIAKALPARLRRRVAGGEPRTGSRAVRWTIAAACAGLFVLSAARMFGSLYGFERVPQSLRAALQVAGPFHLTGGYGLFAVMTKRRPEIVIEGSRDGLLWQAYEFKWKPGDPSARPRFVAPHQPRLDWQMWFAALGDYRRNSWLMNLMQRLLEGSAPVLALLASNPFSSEPPRYVRAMVYDYRFSTPEARSAEGVWWTRSDPKLYAPVLRRE